MKKITYFLTLIFSTLLLSCSNDCTSGIDGEDGYYHNLNMRITSINGVDTANSDKPIPKYSYVLFETLNAPKKYMELSTDNLPRKVYLTDQWFRSHDIGDTVHFDFIDTSRFFRLTQSTLQRFIKTQGTK